MTFAKNHRLNKKHLPNWLPNYLMAVYDFNENYCLVKFAHTKTLDDVIYRLIDAKYREPLSVFLLGVTAHLLVRQHLATTNGAHKTNRANIGLAREKCRIMVLEKLAEELLGMAEIPEGGKNTVYLGSVHYWFIDLFWGDISTDEVPKLTNRIVDADLAHCP